MKKIVTSESVNIGHPDKTCDTLADAFLDEALKQDKDAQMAVECAIKNDKLFIYGESSTTAKIDYEKIASQVLKEIGYENKFTFVKEISIQSPDIASAVKKGKLCANDQGMAIGYACRDTKELMPLPIMVAHKLMKFYNSHKTSEFCPDAKCQVSVLYEDDKPVAFTKVVFSASHKENATNLQEKILKNFIEPVLKEYQKYVTKDTQYIINPSGKFTIWGSFSDSGCVGRKIVVDTYGGVGRVGGGCFSGKNATKVDRSGAYFARYVAKNLVFNNLCDRCEVEIAYAIGLEKPLSVEIETFGTEKVSKEKIYDIVNKNFDFSVDSAIKELKLQSPIFKQTACFGHFGNEKFPWEKVKKLCK